MKNEKMRMQMFNVQSKTNRKSLPDDLRAQQNSDCYFSVLSLLAYSAH